MRAFASKKIFLRPRIGLQLIQVDSSELSLRSIANQQQLNAFSGWQRRGWLAYPRPALCSSSRSFSENFLPTPSPPLHRRSSQHSPFERIGLYRPDTLRPLPVVGTKEGRPWPGLLLLSALNIYVFMLWNSVDAKEVDCQKNVCIALQILVGLIYCLVAVTHSQLPKTFENFL